MARPELIFEFAARYQLDVIDRRRPLQSEDPVSVFPDATVPLAADAEAPMGTTLRIASASSDAWIGVFLTGEWK